MSHNARVLSLTTEAEIAREMELVNAEPPGIRRMLPKARHFMVKLEKVRRPVAHILKETFLSNGGEAAVSGGLITAEVSDSDVILCGTLKQFRRSLSTLVQQGFGCDRIAAEIDEAINRFNSTPLVPDVYDTRLAQMFEAIGKRTLVMGILNVTPDSFSDGGQFINKETAVQHALRMIKDGADIIVVGGESTRPGSDPVPAEEEIARVVPVIEEIANKSKTPISIDTYKAQVARAALDAGASIINDISGASFDPDMPALVAEKHCPAILMHIKGTPKDMQLDPTYRDLMSEVCSFLRGRVQAMVDSGADERMLMVDPGIGFGKTVDHNLEIIRRLRELKSIGRPIVIGTSRKSMIGKVLGDLPVEERLEGTAATVALSIANGADIVRVHDVKEMSRVARMSDAVVRR
ncbi:MAG: dihydropteroate synthase [Armatimonadetes bacterium]|nr:dihydropteroate synthase [Armatimonadota bacterium]